MASSVHVSLTVTDLGRSIAFYRGVFGEPTKHKSDYAKFVNAEPELHLALRPGLTSAATGGALNHLGIRVDSTGDVRRWREEMRQRGVVSEEEKREDCCYALQDKFWVTDPDGNRWEVYTVIEDRDEAAQAGQACCSP
ncbi:MAG: VOC family protein [Acidobacteria bacterium]|nr:VOC family protein [Acidobacteriota bacterium]MCA1609420.1 VOC family protein [Acidobacteriota bacterium]